MMPRFLPSTIFQMYILKLLEDIERDMRLQGMVLVMKFVILMESRGQLFAEEWVEKEILL